jgi:hypothetical protein
MADYRVVESAEEFGMWELRRTPSNHQADARVRPTSDKKRCEVAHILLVSSSKQHPRQNPD